MATLDTGSAQPHRGGPRSWPPRPTPAPTRALAGVWVVDAAERLAEGSDHLKIIVEDGGLYRNPVPTLGQPQVTDLVTAARARRTTSVVHVGSRRDTETAVAACPDGLAHVSGEPLPPDLIARIAAQDTFVIATLAVYDTLSCGGASTALAADPRIAALLTAE